MEVQIVLAPELALNVDACIAQWNATPQTQALARAERGKAGSVAFPLDPHLQQTLIFLAGVASTVTVDVLKDVLKTEITEWIARQRQAHTPSITVDHITQPDGAVLLVVREE